MDMVKGLLSTLTIGFLFGLVVGLIVGLLIGLPFA